MNKQRSVTRREAVVVLAAAVGILALTCVPYLVAAQPGYAGPGLHFAGFIWGVDDGNVYLSQIRQYSEGRLFAYDQFTTLPQTPRYLNLLWLTLGQLHRLTGWPLVTLYHLGRVVGGVLLLYAIYLLAAEMGLARRGRVLAFLLAAFSSGLGWIVYLAVVSGHLSQDQGAALSPVDIAAGGQAMPEALVPLTLLLNPLFAAGIALADPPAAAAVRGAGRRRHGPRVREREDAAGSGGEAAAASRLPWYARRSRLRCRAGKRLIVGSINEQPKAEVGEI